MTKLKKAKVMQGRNIKRYKMMEKSADVVAMYVNRKWNTMLNPLTI